MNRHNDFEEDDKFSRREKFFKKKVYKDDEEKNDRPRERYKRKKNINYEDYIDDDT